MRLSSVFRCCSVCIHIRAGLAALKRRHTATELFHRNRLFPVRSAPHTIREDGYQHTLHLAHFLVIAEKHHAAGKHRDRKHAAQRPQRPDRPVTRRRLLLPLFHPVTEIADHPIAGACLHPAGVLPQNHIVLHHLVFLVVYMISFQTVKPVLRHHIVCCLTVHAAVYVHELVFPAEILLVQPPVGQGT